MMMSSEQQWAADREQFLVDVCEQQQAAAEGRVVAEASRQAGAPSGALASEFAELAGRLFGADTVEDVLGEIVARAVQIVPGAELASVTLLDPQGGYTTPVETDPVATRLDQLQYRSDEGPCLEATRIPGRGVAFSPDLATDGQWPVFGPGAVAEGFHSVLATGLFPASEPNPPRLGSLNLYARPTHGLAETSRTNELLLATHASVALAGARTITNLKQEQDQLHEALQTRDVIGQAKGILMQRQGIDAGRAFDLLRQASQDPQHETRPGRQNPHQPLQRTLSVAPGRGSWKRCRAWQGAAGARAN